jgi:hypothetical protein
VNLMLYLAMMITAVQPISLNEAARKVTEKSLDVIRGGLVDYDFARVEISSVEVRLENSTSDNLRFVLVMEGVGQRRTQFTSPANDALWSVTGQNLISLSVTANCYSEPKGLVAKQGIMVMDGMKVINLAKPFRFFDLTDTFTLKAGPDKNSLNRKSNVFLVTTPIRGSLNLASTPFTCTIVQSH